MKKLMIAACAIALAGIAQASNVDWSVAAKSFLMADGTTKPNGVSVYLVNTSADSWSTALAGIAAGDITAANIASKSFYAGTANTFSVLPAQEALPPFQNGYATVTKTTANGAGVTLTADNYAIVIFDSTTKGSDTYYMVSDVATGKGYTSNPDDGVAVSFSAASFAADKSLSGGWAKVSAVPEPTSGLLLLLGMAGLALKRKRA